MPITASSGGGVSSRMPTLAAADCLMTVAASSSPRGRNGQATRSRPARRIRSPTRSCDRLGGDLEFGFLRRRQPRLPQCGGDRIGRRLGAALVPMRVGAVVELAPVASIGRSRSTTPIPAWRELRDEIGEAAAERRRPVDAAEIRRLDPRLVGHRHDDKGDMPGSQISALPASRSRRARQARRPVRMQDQLVGQEQPIAAAALDARARGRPHEVQATTRSKVTSGVVKRVACCRKCARSPQSARRRRCVTTSTVPRATRCGLNSSA